MGIGLVQVTVQAAPAVTLPPPPGEAAALPNNLIKQVDISNGSLSLKQIRQAGGRVFTTPFNRFDGLGDGPPEIFDANRSFPFRGDRPTIQTRMTAMLRINGLDAQTCQECHSAISNATIPPTRGIGGHGGINNTPMPGTHLLDAKDADGNGITDTTGRIINPPFMFGAGSIELLAKEMTRDLQAIKADVACSTAGTTRTLITKGVKFGSVTSNGSDQPVTIMIDNEQGIDQDLVVRPFSRKGINPTIRDFDREATVFHLGMQAVEVYGADVDADGDGISNELSIGEMSALSIFLATMPRPRHPTKLTDKAAIAGRDLFNNIGCADCHIPRLKTDSQFLTQSFPDIADDPDANVFFKIDLSKKPMEHEKAESGGLYVFLYADLKRHNMGPELAETTGGVLDPFFTTARLWGIADSAPYLHDGRAATLTEAILAHGGEAKRDRINFAALSAEEKIELLTFLRTLRVPAQKDVDELEKLIRGDE